MAAPRKRELRSDARENRVRVLAIAEEMFAESGVQIPIEEVAKRAGLGVGTLYRHFPTKQDLIAAILAERFAKLADECAMFAEAPSPGKTFYLFLERLSAALAKKRDLGDALAGVDLMTPTQASREKLKYSLSRLLDRAQESGAVRSDVNTDDVFALVRATLPPPGAPHSPRVMAVVLDGLRTKPRTTGRRVTGGATGRRPRAARRP